MGRKFYLAYGSNLNVEQKPRQLQWKLKYLLIMDFVAQIPV